MNNKSVPQTNSPITPNERPAPAALEQPARAVQTEFNFSKVRVEPELQIQVAVMPPAERRELALTFFRWGHQLMVSAQLLETQKQPFVRRSLPRIEPSALRLN